MKIILSPAKKMLPVSRSWPVPTQPRFLAQSERLLCELKKYSPWQLEGPLSVSPELALLAHGMYQALDLDAPGSPALLSYQGLQYQHLDAQSLSREEFAFAEELLRVLSAFYGVLRPCDGIGAYRLEFLCKLRFEGKNLYSFWGDTFYRDLFAQGETVVNLASQEYAKAVQPWLRPGDRWIDCVFLQIRQGKAKTLATSAKMARGELARWAVKNRVREPEELRQFSWDGYLFDEQRSSRDRYVFLMH